MVSNLAGFRPHHTAGGSIRPQRLTTVGCDMFEANLLLGRELAVLSADVAMEHFRRGVRVRRKADGSKVY